LNNPPFVVERGASFAPASAPRSTDTRPPFPSAPPSPQLLVDFTASWCGPCKMIGPYFEELAAKYPGVVFVKVDVDDLDDVALECGISAMPTFQLYSNGVKVEELTGADKGKLEALAKQADDL
jgi:thioredoxin 1